jgi:tetratricopeptide (TPR) repeat protein
MRRQTKWVFAFLAVVFAGSFVFLGVGSGGSALTDFLNGNIHLFGSSSGPSVKSLEHKVAKDPTNAAVRLQLAQLLSKNNQFDQSIAQYNAYLKLKPRDESAMNELGTVYGNKVTALQNEIQSPPTPPLSMVDSITPAPSNTVLGTALATLVPQAMSASALQQGESAQIQKQLDKVIQQHVGVYKRIAALTPKDSTAFLGAAEAAGKDGDTALQISLYKQFLTKFPSDPLVPDIKKQITKLQKQQASGTPTTSGSTTPTG